MAACIALALLALSPRSARAFSDLTRFSDGVDRGGGGGHWYTGSPANGYNCAVCHTDGKAVNMMIDGLPDRYQPGATYEVRMTWPDSVANISAVVEFTDEHGVGAGSVHVPGDSVMGLTDPDTCEPKGLHIPATQLFAAPDFEVSNNRQIAGLPDCGGKQMHLQWTAPAQDMGTLFFSGGVVQSNHKSDLFGDGVVTIFRPVLPQAAKAYAMPTAGGCSTARVAAHPLAHDALLLWALSIIAFNTSRRRRR